MIYLDNAATTFPKPENVYRAMDKMNREGAVNAGRGSYKLAQEASKIIADTKSKIRQLVHLDTSAVVFAPSITIARGLVGSANVTNSGFNLGKSGNMEMAAFVDIEEKDIKKIANLFKDAVPVTEDLLEKMKKQLEGINANKTKEENRWDDSIRSLFNPQIETLFSYELPESFELKKGEYFAFLDEEYDGNKENLKNIFRWSNSYLIV